MSETAWNWFSTGGGTSGTGGGVSPTYNIPSWQQGVPSLSTNGGSTTMRNFPDVAMVADAINIYADNGSSLFVGGTSASAPLWAGFTALINQQAAGLGQPPVGFLNPALYAIGTGLGYATNFHDITTGNNTNPTSPLKFYARPSYDLCTGWGTPTGQKLIDTLVPRPFAPLITNAGTSLAAEGCSPPNGAIDPGETVAVHFRPEEPRRRRHDQPCRDLAGRQRSPRPQRPANLRRAPGQRSGHILTAFPLRPMATAGPPSSPRSSFRTAH